jgi:hypothetical protein
LGHSLRRLRGGLPIDILFTDMNLAGHMDGARSPVSPARCFPR